MRRPRRHTARRSPPAAPPHSATPPSASAPPPPPAPTPTAPPSRSQSSRGRSLRSSCRGGHGSGRRRRSGQGSRITSTPHSRSPPRAQPTPKPSHLTQLRRSRQRTQPQPPFSQLSDTQISNGSMAFVLCTVFLVGRLGHRRSRRSRPPQRRCRCPTPRSQRSAPAPYNAAALTQRYARPHNVLSFPCLDSYARPHTLRCPLHFRSVFF